MNRYFNAQIAFEETYKLIAETGKQKSDNLYLNNVGFYIENPLDNVINTPWRKWNENYAKREYNWYLSQNRSVVELKKYAPIWDSMHNGDNIVNSNYGYQWNRNGQLLYVVQELLKNKETRRAVLTIYDGKDHREHLYDTPCTLNIVFSIEDNKLNMSVLMRSNDIWFGFCNDQYCFSCLQKDVANTLRLEVGWYFHFSADMHIYKNIFEKVLRIQNKDVY